MSKVWFVTGASRGIGLAIARAAIAANDQVVATARDPSAILAACPDAGDNLFVIPLDITAGDSTSVVAQAAERFGSIDVLVNNAGFGQLGWFETQSDAQIRKQFETNLFGTMNVTRAVLPLMREAGAGHIFAISSISGIRANAGSSIYSASKFALEGWAEALADEVKPFGIQLTIIEPGFFRTDFLDASSLRFGDVALDHYAELTATLQERLSARNHRQIGDPAKLADLILQVSAMADPPLRLAAGSDAYEVVAARGEAVKAGADRWRTLSCSTDFQDPT